MSVNLENTETWQYFLQQLFNGTPVTHQIDYSDFSSIDLDDLSESIGINKREFWLQLLNSLKNENSFIPNSAAPSSENINFFRRMHLLPSYSYLLNYISSNIDLNYDEDINTWISNNEDNNNLLLYFNKFWNESVAELFKYVIHSFSPNAENGIKLNPDIMNNINENDIPIINIDGSHYYYIDDIKNANAANSFEANEKWVKSWHNAEGETYEQVRGEDVDLKAITNKENLNFTTEIEGIASNINLLMPEHSRNVLIEDLNRNFWVIGQSLTGISAFLFNENSPILTVFKGLIKELIELWENVLFLWLALAISMQDEKKVTEVHEEIIYLYGSDLDDKYNNGTFYEPEMWDLIANDQNDSISNIIKSKIDYLKVKYNNYHLVIVPILFLDNYEGDSYSSFYIHGAFLFNQNQTQNLDWQVIQFRDINLGTRQKVFTSNHFKFINHDFSQAADKEYKISEPANYLIGRTYNNYNDQYLYGTTLNELNLYLNDSNPYYTYNNKNYLNYRGVENSNITYYAIQHLLPMSYFSNHNLHFQPISNQEFRTSEMPILSYYDIENDTLIFNEFTLNIVDYGYKQYCKENNINSLGITDIIDIYQLNGEIHTVYQTNPELSYNINEWWQSVTPNFSTWPLFGYNSSDFTGITQLEICEPKSIITSTINLNTKTAKNISSVFTFEEEIQED